MNATIFKVYNHCALTDGVCSQRQIVWWIYESVAQHKYIINISGVRGIEGEYVREMERENWDGFELWVVETEKNRHLI